MKKILLALTMIFALLTISAVAENKSVTIPDLSDTISGIYVQKEDHRANGTSYYQYNYKYGSSCYQIMQMVADDMVNTGYYKLVGYSTYGDSSFWQLQYIAGGELEPISETNGKPYHVELGCASFSYDVTFVSITLGKGISYGDGYYAPEKTVDYGNEDKITVRDFATFLNGTTIGTIEEGADGVKYYQYNYKYGDSIYPIVDMYATCLKESGLFKMVDYERYGTASFWQLQYIGPGADELTPLSSSGEKYHVELGCANYSYVTSSSAVFTSIKLCDGISLGETTYAEGAKTNEKKLENVSGFSVKTRTVQRTCTVCHGSGSCHLCNGTGTYRMYGQAIECDKICSFCKGEKTYEVLETYYVPN